MGSTATSSSLPTLAHREKDVSRHVIGDLLSKAGIRLDGSRPWDMRLNRPGVLERAAAYGSLGLGEAYMDGDWDCGRLDEFFARVLRARRDRRVKPLRLLPAVLLARLHNRQNARRAWHVGHRNHRSFMQVAARCLADDGIFLLHTIGKNDHGAPSDPWIEKHIFPNGEVPSLKQVCGAIEGLFVAEDMHNFGADYDKTLMAWHVNFEEAWPRFADAMGERFHRMWRYYLLSCAGAFRARDLQVWQWTLSRHGLDGGCPRVS